MATYRSKRLFFYLSLLGTASLLSAPSTALSQVREGLQIFDGSTPKTTLQYDLATDILELVAEGSDSSISLITNGTSRLFISPTGLIGIGTGAPSQALEVLGNVRATRLHASEFCDFYGGNCINTSSMGSSPSIFSSSMLEGWPDALVCNVTDASYSNTKQIFHLKYAPWAGDNRFYYRSVDGHGSTTSYRSLIFLASGGYAETQFIDSSGTSAFLTTDCDSKSISELYADGQAFNFIGGGSSDSGGGDFSFPASYGSAAKTTVTTVASGGTSMTVSGYTSVNQSDDIFEPTTGHLQPSEPGQYIITAATFGGWASDVYLSICKHGDTIECLSSTTAPHSGAGYSAQTSNVLHFNGTTDFASIRLSSYGSGSKDLASVRLNWARVGGGSSSAGDGLGDHTATQNLDLSSHRLVGNGGTAGLSIDSAGNVGIGTDSPERRLHVSGHILSDDGGLMSRIASSEGGSVTLKNPLKTASNIANTWTLFNMTGSYENSLAFWRYAEGTNCADGKLCGPTMKLYDSGLVHIGSSVSSGATTNLRLQGASGGNWWVGPGNAYNVFYILDSATNGVYLPTGTNSWLAHSDERLKEIIEPIEYATEGLMGLRTVVGRYHTDPQDKRRIMLIAQDVQKAFPELVHESEDEEKTLGMNYGDMTPVIIRAFQELKSYFDDLKAQLSQLFASIDDLTQADQQKAVDLEALKAENEKLRASNLRQDAEIEALRADIEALRQAIGR